MKVGLGRKRWFEVAQVFGAMLVLLVGLVACKGGSHGSSSSTGTAKMGETVTFDDSEWIVIEAKDAGKSIKSNSEFNEEEKKTEGRFIQVHYKVTNKGKKEEMLLDRPKIVDDKGREFGPIDMESFYVPAKAKTIGLDTLQPSMPKEYWTVIEVPADAKTLKFQVHGFSLLGDKKNVDLGM
ncbi:MAG TPA: hypothetical protein VGH28_05390 [Polyangiaceae bacterium]